jgi:hypothetical protein
LHKLVAKVKHWIVAPGVAHAPVPFTLSCPCGQKVAGQRQAKHQVVRCAGCGRSLFVLPFSPLPPVSADKAVTPSPAARPRMPSRRSWLLPVAAASLTLAVVIIAFALLLHYLLGKRPAETEDIDTPMTAGQKALKDGNFVVAAEHLKKADAIRERHPEALAAEKSRKLTRLYRQAALLKDLLSESLGEIILKAAGQQRDDWQKEFEYRYYRKAVVFQAPVRWDAAARKYQLEYQIFANKDKVDLDLGNLELLRRLPRLDNPRELLFGARLASIQREGPGRWVIRFVPDSGVFLTDPGAAAACCDRPVDDSLRSLLDQQAKWDEDTP